MNHVLDRVSLGEAVVLRSIQPRPVKEDLFAVVAANETEAPIANHFLDLALALGTGGRLLGSRAASPPATTLAASALASTGTAKVFRGNELGLKQFEGDGQILQAVLLGASDLLPIRSRCPGFVPSAL